MIAVITTIAEPTPSVRRLVEHLQQTGSRLVSVGDKKGPSRFDIDGAVFLPLSKQLAFPFRLPTLLPTGHYARKNIGYLWAFSQGADCVYETDDDNAPNGRWTVRQLTVEAKQVQGSGWVNAYRYFTDELIWPRGLPLNKVRGSQGHVDLSNTPGVTVSAPIQQGLADLSPDVDAVWRLVSDRSFNFRPGPNIYLEPGAWCPFNSQNTWWWPEAYVLMYLPSYCSFRMTDIWRGFVAQRCLWAMCKGVLFFAADVEQERNEHNLQKDFEAEIPGYTGNERLVQVLNRLSLAPDPDKAAENLIACYEALIAESFFPAKELSLVEAWVADFESVRSKLDLVPSSLGK